MLEAINSMSLSSNGLVIFKEFQYSSSGSIIRPSRRYNNILMLPKLRITDKFHEDTIITSECIGISNRSAIFFYFLSTEQNEGAVDFSRTCVCVQRVGEKQKRRKSKWFF